MANMMDQKQTINTVLGVLAVLFFGAAVYLTVKEKPQTVPTPASPIASDEENALPLDGDSEEGQTESLLNPPSDTTSADTSPIYENWGAVYTPLDPNDVNVARESLNQYFKFLAEKQYGLAAGYHGSGWDVLRFWNTSVARDDLATLLKQGCEENGWHCLGIERVNSAIQVTPVKYRFNVAFTESINSENNFDYFVEKVGTRFWVLTPPVRPF